MIRLAARAAQRCAWCHDDALSNDARCGCGTVVHLQCLDGLQRCPTIGCDLLPAPPRSRQVMQAAVGVAVDLLFAAVLVAIVCAGLLAMAGGSVRVVLGEF